MGEQEHLNLVRDVILEWCAYLNCYEPSGTGEEPVFDKTAFTESAQQLAITFKSRGQPEFAKFFLNIRNDGPEAALSLGQDLDVYASLLPVARAAFEWLDFELLTVAAVTPPAASQSLVSDSVGDETVPQELDKPVWRDRQLIVDGKVVAEWVARAQNQIRILDVFQEEGWRVRIDDPLPGGDGDPGGRLRDTIRSLNDKQEVIRFSSDGKGEGVQWKFCGSSLGENPHTSPTENP